MASGGVRPELTVGVDRKKSTSYSADSPSAADILVDEETSESQQSPKDELRTKKPVGVIGLADDQHTLTSKQRKRLGQILQRVYEVHGRNGTTLRCQAVDMIKAMSRLLHEAGVSVRNMQIVGGVATYTACDREDIPYNDLDIRVTLDCAPEVRDATFYKLKLPQIVVEAAWQASPDEPDPATHSGRTHLQPYVETNYYHAPTENDGDDDEWSIIKLRNDIGQNLELKFITRLRREFVFPQDAFQIILPSLAQEQMMEIPDILLKARIRTAWREGDYERAKRLSDDKLIRFVNPEAVRGGGIFRYCDMLSQGYKPHPDYGNDMIIQNLKRMLVRFCIDYPTKKVQGEQLERYLHNHFREGGVRQRETHLFLAALEDLCDSRSELFTKSRVNFNLTDSINKAKMAGLTRACPIPKNVYGPRAWTGQLPPLPQVPMAPPGTVPISGMMPPYMVPSFVMAPGVPMAMQVIQYTQEQLQAIHNQVHLQAMLNSGLAPVYTQMPTQLRTPPTDPPTASYGSGSPAMRQSSRSRTQDVRARLVRPHGRDGSDEEVSHMLQEVPRVPHGAFKLEAQAVSNALHGFSTKEGVWNQTMPAYQRERASRRGRRSGSPGDDVMEMLQTMGIDTRQPSVRRSRFEQLTRRDAEEIHALVESMTYESLSSNRTSSRGSTASPELHPRQRLPNRPSQHQQRSTRSKKKKKSWRNSEAARRPNSDAPRQPNSQSYNARRSGKNRGKRYNTRNDGYDGSRSPPGKQNRKNYRKGNFRGRGDRSNGADSVNWRRRDDAETLQLPHPRAQRREEFRYGRGEDSGRNSGK